MVINHWSNDAMVTNIENFFLNLSSFRNCEQTNCQILLGQRFQIYVPNVNVFKLVLLVITWDIASSHTDNFDVSIRNNLEYSISKSLQNRKYFYKFWCYRKFIRYHHCYLLALTGAFDIASFFYLNCFLLTQICLSRSLLVSHDNLQPTCFCCFQ